MNNAFPCIRTRSSAEAPQNRPDAQLGVWFVASPNKTGEIRVWGHKPINRCEWGQGEERRKNNRPERGAGGVGKGMSLIHLLFCSV